MYVPTLTFAGGAGTVTGSKYLIERGDTRILLECGMFQGVEALRRRNWEAPPFSPEHLDAVVLSHAHIDHAGYLPVLVRRGYSGRIHCTGATADLLVPLLTDAAHLQEEDARRANFYGYSRHNPALPLFTTEDAERVFALLAPQAYGEPVAIADGACLRLRRAGHILGAATVDLDLAWPEPTRLVFSGDLGRWNRPILRDPDPGGDADVLLVESTYGDRVHRGDPDRQLERLIADTVARGGVMIVPAFAIGRTQELLWRVAALRSAGRIAPIPVYVDSPMALDVTDIYARHTEEHDIDMLRLVREHRCPLSPRDFTLVRTADESKALNDIKGSAIIIAGSGMATGGRVLHHLMRRLPDPRHSVVFVGYQAVGTRGRLLQDGASTVRIHGADVPVNARVETLDGLSAHADRLELLDWLRTFRRPPRKTWVVHGELDAATSLACAIRNDLGWAADVARDGATVALTGDALPVRAHR